MSIAHKSLPYLYFFAGSIFLFRGVKLLISNVSSVLADVPSSAYEHGYTFGQVAASVLFIASAIGLFLLGRRRLRTQRSHSSSSGPHAA